MEKAITAQIQKYRNTYISIIKGKRREVSMDIKQIKENKIKMILQFSIPSIIAMLLQTVITITDGYFTGNQFGIADTVFWQVRILFSYVHMRRMVKIQSC